MKLFRTFTIIVICLSISVMAFGVDFSMKGYATVSGEGYETTTGGEGGDTVHINSLEELNTWAGTRENDTVPEVAIIHGKISSESTITVTIKHGKNISVIGAEEYAEMENIGLVIWDYHNVIVRNMKIHEVFYPSDALSIDECLHVWVDHCEFHSKIGDGIGVDTYDGLLDIKKGSRYVTVSWCYFHDHMKDMLIGHTDNATQGEEDKAMRITIHHNFFQNTDGRNPSLRWGAVHLFNNYFENISDYGIAVRQGAHAKIENNHYHSVDIPITTNKFDGLEGFVCESGTKYSGTCTSEDNSITQTDCDFWNDLPYSYSLDLTDDVKTIVMENAGIGKLTPVSIDHDLNMKAYFTMYPNPAKEVLNISFNRENEFEDISVEILDIYGKMHIKNNYKNTDNKILTIHTQNLIPGIYLVKTKINNKSATKILTIL